MIVAALKSLGPCLSTDLADYLVRHHKLKPEAARQRISRAPAEVKRLAYLPFARKARFLYLKEEFASPRYWDSLLKAIYATKGAYARALGAVEARGVVPLEHFKTICGAPIAQQKHISAATVLNRLVDASVLVRTDLPGLGTCVMTKRTYDSTRVGTGEQVASTRARLISEEILLESLKEWMRRLGLVSFNLVSLRNSSLEPPTVGTFAWDLTAPSYLSAVVTRGKDKLKPGLVVCDVLLKGEVKLHHVEAYLYKVASLQALKKVGRTLFFFVAHRYERDAYAALRSAGVVPATPESLFGAEIAAAFVDLSGTLTRAALGTLDAAKFDELFNKLGKLEGAVGNMRGAFFELLVAEIVRKTSPSDIELNKICTGDDGKAEVDVWDVKQGVVARFIECKGQAPDSFVDDEEIELWLNTRILRVRQHFARQFNWTGPKPRFELWATGMLSETALQKIERTRIANSAKFDLVVFGPEEIRAATVAVNDLPLLRTLEHHFIPLASFPSRNGIPKADV